MMRFSRVARTSINLASLTAIYCDIPRYIAISSELYSRVTVFHMFRYVSVMLRYASLIARDQHIDPP